MEGYVEAVCVVFPSGETFWVEKNQAIVSALTALWIERNPKYGKNTPCSMSACVITMPKEDFERVSKRARQESALWLPRTI